MGQQKVYDLLKKYGKRWFNAREITRLLNTSFNNATCNLKRLRNADVIMCKTITKIIKPAGRRNIYIYKYKK